MLMRRNGIGSNEQGEYCRAALQRSDRKEPRYEWPTLLYKSIVSPCFDSRCITIKRKFVLSIQIKKIYNCSIQRHLNT